MRPRPRKQVLAQADALSAVGGLTDRVTKFCWKVIRDEDKW